MLSCLINPFGVTSAGMFTHSDEFCREPTASEEDSKHRFQPVKMIHWPHPNVTLQSAPGGRGTAQLPHPLTLAL